MFKVDYSNVQESSFAPLPEGNYECIIESSQEITTRNNKEGLNLRLVVRNDLKNAPTLAETNGKHADRLLFDTHWKRDIDGRYIYHVENLMYVLKAAQIPEGTEINSMDDLHEMLTGKPVKIYAKVEYNDYQGEDENTIAPWGYSVSDFPQVQHIKKSKDNVAEGTFEKNDNPTTVEDDDLPF